MAVDRNSIEASCDGGLQSRLERLARDLGLTISALANHWDSQLVLGPYHALTDPLLAGTPQQKAAHGKRRTLLAAELAAALGVPTVTGFAGCPDFSAWFPWPDPQAWASMAPAFRDSWGPLMEAFAQRGVTFAHECHPLQIAYNTETALQAIEILGGAPAWGYNLDPANLMIAGVDPVLFVSLLSGRIHNVHAKDHETVAHNAARSGTMAQGAWGRLDRGFRFRVPGWGDLNWHRLLTELHMQGYDGTVSLENEDPTMGMAEGVAKGLAYLRPLLLSTRPEAEWW
ncbi:MAG: sugar phosphate isomerase/epimerase [Armatimonadota bacterium]